eukprot:5679474-Amphidinium_carterae.1
MHLINKVYKLALPLDAAACGRAQDPCLVSSNCTTSSKTTRYKQTTGKDGQIIVTAHMELLLYLFCRDM